MANETSIISVNNSSLRENKQKEKDDFKLFIT